MVPILGHRRLLQIGIVSILGMWCIIVGHGGYFRSVSSILGMRCLFYVGVALVDQWWVLKVCVGQGGCCRSLVNILGM